MMGMTLFAVPIFAGLTGRTAYLSHAAFIEIVNKERSLQSKDMVMKMKIRKKCLALFMALVMVLGIGMVKGPMVTAEPISASSVAASEAPRDQEEEEDRPYWLLVVAIFFFISVTTGVVAVVIYSKKSVKKPEDSEIKDNKEE